MKELFEQIRKIVKKQPRWEKTICTECINRIEKMIKKINKEKYKKEVIQTLNPWVNRYIKIDKGRWIIISIKKSPWPYKWITILK